LQLESLQVLGREAVKALLFMMQLQHGWRMKETAHLAECSLYCGTPRDRGSLHSLTGAIVQASSMRKSLTNIDA
jgi:hypothetical protein